MQFKQTHTSTAIQFNSINKTSALFNMLIKEENWNEWQSFEVVTKSRLIWFLMPKHYFALVTVNMIIWKRTFWLNLTQLNCIWTRNHLSCSLSNILTTSIEIQFGMFYDQIILKKLIFEKIHKIVIIIIIRKNPRSWIIRVD